MNIRLIVLITLLASSTGFAQPAPAPEEAPETIPAPAAPEPATEPPPPPPEGDVIYLKSGKIMSGGQVLRKGPTGIYVQVVPGVEPLHLPLGQIDRVEYDDIDPSSQRTRSSRTAKDEEPDYIQGKELSPVLSKKLRASISDVPLNIANEDYVNVLTRIAERMDIALTIGPKILDLAPEERAWSAEVPAGTTFIALLYEHLLRKFPRVKETYEFDKIQLSLRRPDEPGPSTTPPPLFQDQPADDQGAENVPIAPPGALPASEAPEDAPPAPAPNAEPAPAPSLPAE